MVRRTCREKIDIRKKEVAFSGQQSFFFGQLAIGFEFHYHLMDSLIGLKQYFTVMLLVPLLSYFLIIGIDLPCLAR